MPETEPTPWELMRVLRDIREDVRSMKAQMVTRDEWTAAQQTIDRRFGEVDKRHTEWKTESQKAHSELDAKIDAVKKDVAAENRAQRDSKAKLWIGVGMVFLAAVAPRIIQMFIGAPL